MLRSLIAGLILILLSFAGCFSEQGVDNSTSVNGDKEVHTASSSSPDLSTDSVQSLSATGTATPSTTREDSLVQALGCQCKGWLEGASTQIPVEYANDRGVLLCAHIADGSRDSLAAYNFGIVACDGPLLFESEGTTENVVQAGTSPLTITEHLHVPGEASLFQSQPVAMRVVQLTDNGFQIETSIIYDPPPMPPVKADSVKRLAGRLAATSDSVAAPREEMNLEALVAELFWCAMDGDQTCRQRFEDVQHWTDGASGEGWARFNQLLKAQDERRPN